MQTIIDKLIGDFERGRLTRRQLALSLTALVTGARFASAKPELQAVSLNHVTVKVANVQRTSTFYQELFSMPLRQHSQTTHISVSETAFLESKKRMVGQRSIITTSALRALMPMT
jgi:catechol-2,3-dioxygenase